MTKAEIVLQMLNQNNGYITTKEVRNANIDSIVLTRLVREKKLERVSRGVYSIPNIFGDEYYMIQSKCKNCIYSHATALYFYDLSDRVPLIFDITIPNGYNGVFRTMNNIDLHYVKRENLDLGLTIVESPFGMKIKVYDMERTICDIIKNKNSMDIEIFTKALQRYSKLKTKDLNKLMRYAKKLNIEKKVREYMEVLI